MKMLLVLFAFLIVPVNGLSIEPPLKSISDSIEVNEEFMREIGLDIEIKALDSDYLSTKIIFSKELKLKIEEGHLEVVYAVVNPKNIGLLFYENIFTTTEKVLLIGLEQRVSVVLNDEYLGRARGIYYCMLRGKGETADSLQ